MRSWRYHKIFEEATQPTADPIAKEELWRAFAALRNDPLRQPQPSTLPAAYTYFGQFIDHDLSLMRQLSLPVEADLTVEQLEQGRNPSLDLDTLYGGGLEDSVIPFDKDTGKFLLRECTDEEGERDHFLRRDAHKMALIGDQRNDENLFVSRLQVLFMLLHNRIAQQVMEEGERRAERIFAKAREEVIIIYQYLVLHDFAERMVPRDVYENIIGKAQVTLSKSSRHNPSLPVEFAAAAFRLHGLVRNTYGLRIPKSGGKPPLIPLSDLLNPRNASIFPGFTRTDPVPTDQSLDWRLFFSSELQGGGEGTFNEAMSLSPLTQIPTFGKVDMPVLSIDRGYQLGLVSGQAAHEFLETKQPTLFAAIKPVKYTLEVETPIPDLKAALPLPAGNPLRWHTPLWLYLMLEAVYDHRGQMGQTHKLGRLGGWIVADTLYAAMRSADVNLENRSISESIIWRIPGSPKVNVKAPLLTLKTIAEFVYTNVTSLLSLKKGDFRV